MNKKKVVKYAVLVFFVVGGIWFFRGPGGAIIDFVQAGMFNKPPEKRAWKGTEEDDLKAIYTAMMLYHDSEGQFPKAEEWMDAIENRIRTNDLSKHQAQKKLIRPDLIGQEGKFGYGMNDLASGQYIEDIKDPSTTPLIFESKNTDRNAHGIPEEGMLAHPKGETLAISVDGTILHL